MYPVSFFCQAFRPRTEKVRKGPIRRREKWLENTVLICISHKMTNTQKALIRFQRGFNCAQSVLSAFGPSLGLNRKLCLKIGAPLGAGMGRRQEVCGAVTGAFMVIGLARGNDRAEDELAKETAYELADEFANRFISRNGSISCRELLGCDMNTDEGWKHIQENKLFETLCANLVRDAVAVLEELLRPSAAAPH